MIEFEAFEKFLTILNVWVDILRVFFQLVSVIKKLNSKFESFLNEELKILNNNLIQYVYLFLFTVLNIPRGL